MARVPQNSPGRLLRPASRRLFGRLSVCGRNVCTCCWLFLTLAHMGLGLMGAYLHGGTFAVILPFLHGACWLGPWPYGLPGSVGRPRNPRCHMLVNRAHELSALMGACQVL